MGACFAMYRRRDLLGAEKEAAMVEGLLLAALYMYKVCTSCSRVSTTTASLLRRF